MRIRVTEAHMRRLIREAVDDAMSESIYQRFKASNTFRYTMVYYLTQEGYLLHGGDEEFDTFDTSRIRGSNRAKYGYGAYFTDAAYKCEEHGKNFVILDARDFKFLDLEQKVKDNVIFSRNGENTEEDLMVQLYRAKACCDEADNNSDYDYWSGEVERLETEIEKTRKSASQDVFRQLYDKITAKYPDITYENLNKMIMNSFGADEGAKLVSQAYLRQGYDGCVCGVEYVIFNFDKLNQNIVRDKEKLLRDIYVKYEMNKQ